MVKVFGVDQAKAVKHGLNIDDVMLLQLIASEFAEHNAQVVGYSGAHYVLIECQKFLDDYPLLGISARTLRRRIATLIGKGMLDRRTLVDENGVQSYYALGSAYLDLDADRTVASQTPRVKRKDEQRRPSLRKRYSRRNDCGLSAWRKRVLARDSGMCTNCGTTNNLVVHHIRPYASNPLLRTETSNGITLCWECHVAEHKRLRERAAE